MAFAFAEDKIAADPILKYFSFGHLPAHLRGMSEQYARLAFYTVSTSAKSEERDVALRKLLEAKDAAVRSIV